MFFCTIEIAERRQSKKFMNYSHQRARLSFSVDFTKVTLKQKNLIIKKKGIYCSTITIIRKNVGRQTCAR